MIQKTQVRRSATERRPLRSESINCRVTEAEHLSLIRDAVKLGVTISDVIRARIFRRTS